MIGGKKAARIPKSQPQRCHGGGGRDKANQNIPRHGSEHGPGRRPAHADSSPSATTDVEPANPPTTIFATASNALTRMLISATRFPICMLDAAKTLPLRQCSKELVRLRN